MKNKIFILLFVLCLLLLIDQRQAQNVVSSQYCGNNCLNGGSCINATGTTNSQQNLFICSCTSGFTGSTCASALAAAATTRASVACGTLFCQNVKNYFDIKLGLKPIKFMRLYIYCYN